jgi:hypothetical protein
MSGERQVRAAPIGDHCVVYKAKASGWEWVCSCGETWRAPADAPKDADEQAALAIRSSIEHINEKGGAFWPSKS